MSLNDPDGIWKQVIGWVGGRKKDSMRLREDTGRYAHEKCVLLEAEGQSPDQDTLFSASEAIDLRGEPEVPEVLIDNDTC